MHVQFPRYGLILLALLPAWAAAQAFSVPAAENAQVEAVYGISGKANAASSVKLSVDSGVLRADIALRSDSTLAYSANAELNIPLRFDRKRTDLRWFTELTLEFRNSAPITEHLQVAFESAAYPAVDVAAGHIYQYALTRPSDLASGATWKTVSFLISDFELPSWWTPPVLYPTRDSAFQAATVLKISPRSFYSDSGFEAEGKKCAKCVNPTTSSVTLEIRKIILSGMHCDNFDPNSGILNCEPIIGLPNPALGVHERRVLVSSNEVVLKAGILSIQNPVRWSKADLVGLDGQVVRALPLQSQQSLDLPRGAFRVVLRARDGSSASFAVVGIR